MLTAIILDELRFLFELLKIIDECVIFRNLWFLHNLGDQSYCA